ncbi:hypothetical protein N4R57_20515 [Rhodobacteraceae bacterium D3-12]|nr:hypothetical protein N4R57_20515 [Rhodobacteraceae bacterium D3-12]
MIDRDDLRAAVSAGILTEAQAASLTGLAHSRTGARENLAPGDEPFELFKGFNEIFIVIGLLILASGWVSVNAVAMATEIVNYRLQTMTMAGIGAVVLWLLSEYFIRRRRMIAPAIALSILFAINALVGLTASESQPFMIAQQDYSSLPYPVLLSALAVLVYWWRFRVPFALAMIAIGLFLAAILIAANSAGTPGDFNDLFQLSVDGPFAWITLALGLGVFIVAMLFDMSDPHRVTRRAANGFWLHVVAAPALVNTVALSLLARDSAGAHFTLLVALGLFALVAIVIDRRSFLITAIGYIVVMATTIYTDNNWAMIILLLGVALLILGAFWDRIRAVLLRAMPFLPLSKLPPSLG